MKTKYLYTASLCLMMMFGSCSDFLDQEPDTILTQDQTYGDEALMKSGVTADTTSSGSTEAGDTTGGTTGADNSQPQEGQDNSQPDSSNPTGDNTPEEDPGAGEGAQE